MSKGKKNTRHVNNVDPRQVLKTAREFYWFTCPDDKCGKQFQMSPFNITVRGLWCPHCFERENKEVIENLKKISRKLDMTLIVNPDFEWSPECFYLKENHGPFDFIIRFLPGTQPNSSVPEGEKSPLETEVSEHETERKETDVFLEKQLDNGVKAHGMLLVRFSPEEVTDKSWVTSLEKYMERLGIREGGKCVCREKHRKNSKK